MERKETLKLTHYILISIFLSISLFSEEIAQNVDSIKNQIEILPDGTEKVDAINNLSYQLRRISPEDSYEYALLAVKLADQINYPKGRAEAMKNTGIYLVNKGDYDQALDFFVKALSMAEEENDKKFQSKLLNNIAVVYQRLNRYDQSLLYHQKSLKISEELKDSTGIVLSLTNIGVFYDDQKLFQKALNYYFRALEFSSIIEDDQSTATIYNNVGKIYDAQGEYEKAIKQFNNSISLCEKSGDTKLLSVTEHNLALTRFRQALNEENDEQKKNLLLESLAYTINSKVLKEEINNQKGLLVTNRLLGLIYSELGDYENAFKFQNEYLKLKDKIYNEETSAKIDEIETRYEREREIKEAREREIMIQDRNFQQYAFIFTLVILFGMTLFLVGRIQINEIFARAVVFLTFILLFEFILVMIDPVTDEISEGEPLIKFSINLALALVIFPLHQYFERRIKGKVIRREEKIKNYISNSNTRSVD